MQNILKILVIYSLATTSLTYKWCPKRETLQCNPVTDTDTCQIPPAKKDCEVTNGQISHSGDCYQRYPSCKPGQLCCLNACNKMHCEESVENGFQGTFIEDMLDFLHKDQ